ncbi:hypothetical protein SAMN05421764_102532 [Donghicola eburneus]|uniref:Uncharacterized protein n=1 Tax=Donghicola eburneus TaxID=393278 RepID=A0A1M4N451_9RHOB|nr:hypothetical protein KARMA_2931 [Donghicola eburneus]SFQ30391.1 hypothetical protein SAMN05421764_102532 [Donghicola eburneus]
MLAHYTDAFAGLCAAFEVAMGFDRQVCEKEGIYGAFEADRDNLTVQAINKRPSSEIGKGPFSLFLISQQVSRN